MASVTFRNVRPGIALSPTEADRLRGEIWAVLSGMGTTGVGAHCNIPNFKLGDGRKIPVVATVVASDGKNLTVDLS